MTGSEIVHIVVTVAITQCACDMVARWLVFSRAPYKRAVDDLKRAKEKKDRLEATLDDTTPQAKKGKQAKKIHRYQEDCSTMAAEVARKHMLPTFFTSIVFLILYRILSTEYSSKVVAILPFTPFSLLRRLTQRGLEIDKSDPSMYPACSFLFIYILSTISVKFFVHKVSGVSPPKDASGGLTTVLDAPNNQKMMKSLGLDPDLLKLS